jgi:hypothetical protein
MPDSVRVSVENLRVAPVPLIPVEIGEILAGGSFEECGAVRASLINLLKQVVGQGYARLDSHKMVVLPDRVTIVQSRGTSPERDYPNY